jgi:ATP-dependent Clp protease ATP-binding subunit ClpB
MQQDKFTTRAREALVEAQKLAASYNHSELKVEHLLLSLLEQKEGVIPSLLKRLGVPSDSIVERLREHLDNQPSVSGMTSTDIYPSQDLKKLFDAADREASQLGDEYISTEHFLLALLEVGDSFAASLLTARGLDRNRVLESLKTIRGSQSVTDQNPEEKYEVLEKYGRDITQLARQEKIDPVIGRDEEIRRLMQILTRRTKNNPVLIGEPGVGKTAIVEGLARRIVESDVPRGLENKRLIELDVSAMVAGAKYRGEFEDRLKAFMKEVVESEGEIILFIDEMHTVVGAGAAEGSVDASNMLKPPLARGELRAIGATTLDEYKKHVEKDPALERRFQQVLVEEPTVEDAISILRGLRERYEVHHGVKIQDSALVAAARLSDRYIGGRFLPDKAIDLMDEAASALRIEMDSMPAELDRLEREIMQLEMEKQALSKETDSDSEKRLEGVKKELADLEEKRSEFKSKWQNEKQILDRLRSIQEDIEQARIRQQQAQWSGNLEEASQIQYGKLPELQQKLEAAEEDLSELHEGQRMLKEEVTEDDIARIVARWTGIPVSRLLEGEKEKLLNMEERLRQRVVGQQEAVKAVSDAVRRARSGLQDPGRPIGSFIFMGPTGVGKTELARSLAEFLFDDEDNMIRVDMSEFMEKHSVARFIGAPPGYVGYEEGGYLTEQVRRKPYSVILFDEIEKAHRDVFNSMLQILDDGRLTDGQGRTVDFRNTVLVMTSNIGSQYIQEAFEKNPQLPEESSEYRGMEDKVRRSMRDNFRPEFLNRVDETIIFHSLSMEDLRQIVEIQLRRLMPRLTEQGLSIEISDAAKNLLAEKGYDPVYGARPLKRTIQNEIIDPLALQVLEGNYQSGDKIKVTLSPDGSSFVFN